jgi:GDPmannose 4,6-dehydratase
MMAGADSVDCRGRRALITGVTGQDGSYLAELLLAKGYEVHGLVRRASTFNTSRIDHLVRDEHEKGVRLFRHYGDMTDGTGLRRVIELVRPNEVYNLASQSHVRVSFDQPEYTFDVVATGTVRLLDCLRDYVQQSGERVRIYQAGSSEMFGAAAPPQHENTPFRPRSPYAVSKVAAHWAAVNYRDSYGMFIANGILFNHESPRRGETFVTRKISRAVARMALGLQDRLYLGNLEARRDWGFAGDYVEAMWQMLQQPSPDDFVIATGESRSVREFLDAAFVQVGLDSRGRVEIDPKYFRPTEVDNLCGDASKARRILGWEPQLRFERLVAMMVEADLASARRDAARSAAGSPGAPA